MLKRLFQLIALIITTLGSAALYRWWHIRQKRRPAPMPLSLIRQVPEDITLSRPTLDSLRIHWQRQSHQTQIHLRPMAATKSKAQKQTVHDVNTLIMNGLNPQIRYMAEITFDDNSCHKVAERIVPLKTVPNFRDMGGYPTKDGYRIRWNRVYRASRLSNLSHEDSQTLINMGIQLVCDLRTADEVKHEPDKLPDGVKFLHLPAETTANRWLALYRMMFVPDYLPNLLLNAYCHVIIDENPQIFTQIFHQLADANNYPVVLHCAAGKDRTGIATALIYSLLGVADDVIIADYTQSNIYYEFFRDTTQRVMLQLQFFGISESDFDYLLIADGDLMQKTLQHIRTKYGSIETYLTSIAAVDSTTLDRVKKNLLE